MKVVVIGAGIAGLTAARILLEAGIDCQIVEARNRVGGRICQAREFDVPVDLGASWIHQVNGNPLWTVAEQLKLKVDTTCNPYLTGEGGFELFDNDGNLFDATAQSETRQKFQLLTEKGVELLALLDTDVSAHHMFSMAQEKLDDIPHDPTFLAWLLAGIEGWENTNLSQLSARNHFGEVDNPEFTGGDAFIVDGFFSIVNHVANQVRAYGSDRILLEHIVSNIEQDEKSVYVTTTQGTLCADYVISTFPLGVLQSGSVTFNPALPDHKLNAINKVGFGVMNKIVLEFPECFWKSSVEGIGFMSSSIQGEFNFFLNMQPLLNRPILMCFVAADFAHLMEKMSDSQIIDRIMEILTKTHGGKPIAHPVKYHITRWRSDPFSRGSYSFMKVGSSMNDVNSLAEPVGRLHFAGEATFVYPGYTHGAFLSAHREANRIIEKVHEERKQQLELQDGEFPQQLMK